MAESLMRYLGGKSVLADELAGRIYLYANQFGLTRYVEACGGSGKVLMEVPNCLHRVYNDKGKGLADLMRCLKNQDTIEQLITLLRDIEYNRATFKHAVKNWDNSDTSALERAAYAYQAAQQSIVGNMKDYYLTYYPAENEEMIADYYHSLDNLHGFYWLMNDVEVRNEDFLDILPEYIYDPSTILLIDPPYFVKVCSGNQKKHYKNHLDEAGHIKMIKLLLSIPHRKKSATGAKVIVCGYMTELYDELLADGWWKTLIDRIPVTSSSFGGSNLEIRETDEYIFTNFDPNILRN